MREMIESPARGETPADRPQGYGLSLTVVPKDLYYVERALVARQAAEIEKLLAALEPFAGLLDRWTEDADTPPIRPGQTTIEMGIKIADMQRAKAAYARNQKTA